MGKKIGIINVCNFPMQAEAYSCDEQLASSKINRLRDRLTSYTNNTISNFGYKVSNELITKIKNDLSKLRDTKILANLKKELQKFDNLKTIVICGNISLGLISYFDLFNDFKRVFIPHPSQQSWDNKKTIEIRNSVLDEIVKLLTNA